MYGRNNMGFIVEKVSKDGVVFKRQVTEVNTSVPANKKSLARVKINEQVFDIHDSIADTTKWLSLLSSMVARIYLAMPEEQKATMPVPERQMIEYAFSKFMGATTRADVQFEQEGIAMIDKLFERQTKIAEIVK